MSRLHKLIVQIHPSVLTNLRLFSWFLDHVRKSLFSTLSCNLLTFWYHELLLTSSSLLRELRNFLTKLQWLPLFKRWLDFYLPWLLEHALHASKRVLGPTPYLKRPFWETTDNSYWALLCHSRTWKKMRVMTTLLCSMTTPKERVLITPRSYWGWELRRGSCHGLTPDSSPRLIQTNVPIECATTYWRFWESRRIWAKLEWRRLYPLGG